MATNIIDDSDSSSLSEAPEVEVQKLAPIFLKAKGAKSKFTKPPPTATPPKPKRPPSPPREEVLADNPDIPFITIFRSRFAAAFPPKLSHFGPQDIECGVQDAVPSPQVENLLCALLALVLNRKKPVERGHHGRALEEAVLGQKSQWPRSWGGVNPLHGNRSFSAMTAQERLNLLRTLIVWSLSTSDLVSGMIKDAYKQQRHNDDENQALSVQPWGTDGDKRRYFLVEGQDDTSFRVYREGARYTKNAAWWSVAGTIDEVNALAKKLDDEDGTQVARRLAIKIYNAVPRFEATEEKVRRREYRQVRRAAFARPEPGFSLYEGRTRGKRMRYTYDDEDKDLDSDATSVRRSTRQSGRNTPAETGPTFTASGRQVKSRFRGSYGESLLSGQAQSADDLAPSHSEREGSDGSEPVRGGTRGRVMRSTDQGPVNGVSKLRKHIGGYNSIDEMSDEDDASPSENEWDGGRDDDEDVVKAQDSAEEDQEMSDSADESDLDELPKSLVVKLKLPSSSPTARTLIGTQTPMTDMEGSSQSRAESNIRAAPTNGNRVTQVSNIGTKRAPEEAALGDSNARHVKPKLESERELKVVEEAAQQPSVSARNGIPSAPRSHAALGTTKGPVVPNGIGSQHGMAPAETYTDDVHQQSGNDYPNA